ncbi:hypothetical protein [Aliiroseovarius marinus]|uniref:hypothetical protein n=1 Tax=Aliiroseovarius marinus TaxID=2500159 RepID=UPI00105BD55A|nr:hypothetical protein [Aliiroseovarius marinus]
MSIKFEAVFLADAKPLQGNFRIDIAAPTRPDQIAYSTRLNDRGVAFVSFERPPMMRKLIVILVNENTKKEVFRSDSIALNTLGGELVFDVKPGDVTPGATDTVALKFRLSLLTAKSKPLGDVQVALLEDGDPKRVLLLDETDSKGRLNVDLQIASAIKTIAVAVSRKGFNRPEFISEPRKVSSISSAWAVEVDTIAPEPSDNQDNDRPTAGPIFPGSAQPKPQMPEPVLDETGKPVKGVKLKRPHPKDRIAGRLNKKLELQDAMRKAAGEEIKRRKEIRRRGKSHAGKVLGQKPMGKLAGPGKFVPQGHTGRPEQNDQIKVFEQDLGKKAGTVSRIPLPDHLVRDLGLRPGGRVPEGLLGDLLGEARPNGTVSPDFSTTPWQQILRDCASKYKVQDPANPAPDDEDDSSDDTSDLTEDTSTETVTIQERIDRILNAALGGIDGRPTSEDITQSLEIELPKGPADVDAYYDFHTINVAWAEIWSAVADDDLKDRMAELYDVIVEVVPPEDIEADLSEIDELHDMLDTLADSVAAASSTLSGTVNAAPEHIRSWVPSVAEYWEHLTETEKEYVELQYDIWVFLGDPNVLLEHPFDYLDGKNVGEFQNQPHGWVDHVMVPYAFATRPSYPGRAESFVNLDRAKENAEKPLDTYSSAAASRLGRAERLIGELKSQIVAPYQFDVFAPGAYNFGYMTTWRQRWRPLNYQVGDLAGSIPLAPNEKRSYTITRSSKSTSSTSRSRNRVIKSMDEVNANRRAEAQIVGNVQRNMSAGGQANYGANAGVSTGVASMGYNFGASTNFSAGQTSNSERTKKAIRDITTKVVQEYRDENKVTVSAETSYETSYTESRELSNPNNEITVTYLFYELQRRFEVTERLHDLQPVILLAYDMPAPSEITEAWLLKHDWIIEEVLLDDSFANALVYLRQTFSGDEVAVEILEQQWKTQLAVVADLRRQGAAHQRLRDAARQAVTDAVTIVGHAEAGEAFHQGGIGRSLGERLYSAESEMADAMAENARSSLEWAEQDLNRIESAAREAMTALENATRVYVEAVEKRLNRRTQIDRLILHVKDNILHYMQAIWAREHVDQRYLRFYDDEIQWPGQAAGTVVDTQTVARPNPLATVAWPPMVPVPDIPDELYIDIEVPRFRQTRKLYEVTDLGNLLGFRGNLGVFPLTEHNALSTFMAQEFMDVQFGLRDPSPLSFLPTATEAIEIAECSWKNKELTETGRKRIAEWLMDTLAAAHKISREVTVPTGELFIEALPGAHPLLEDFKLKHRAFDAALAATNVRASQLDLIRRAMKLMEDDTGDPDIDRVVQVQGASQIGINIEDPS